MQYLAEYGLFFAKFITVFLVIGLVIAGVILMFIRSKGDMDGHIKITNINRKFEAVDEMLKSQILPKEEFKQFLKEKKSEYKKSKKKPADQQRKKLFVVDFKGDIKASEVTSLREIITAILTVTNSNDEILVLLESAGGTVHGYGLCASQLKRIRDKGVNLTVSVDKVAASGGYMMACVANRIIAAPFAIIGSVGVLAQIPNFNRLLKKHNIDFEQITAGEYKRTLTLFGENTDKDREKMKQELEETHELFKEFIKDNRDVVDIDKISTGEHWYGKKALELKLVDELMTSDDYLCSAAENADLFHIDYVRKKPVSEKIFSFGARLLEQIR